MKKFIPFNLNQTIKVKLNDKGKDIYYHQYDSWIHTTDLKPSYPSVDEEGYTEFQAWKFIELYGEHIGICKTPPFEIDILVESIDKNKC